MQAEKSITTRGSHICEMFLVWVYLSEVMAEDSAASASQNLYERDTSTETEIRRKLDSIKERKGLGTLMGVFIPNSSDVC